MDAFDLLDVPSKKSTGDGFDQIDISEPFWKSASRYAAQIPLGIASTTTPGLLAGAQEILGMGEAMDPEEIEHIRKIAEREGIPFDEEKYMEAVQNALGTVPTVSNISSFVENKTGIPLTPKTRGQKALRFATEATRLAPQPGSIRGTNISLPKPILGAGVEASKEALIEAGVPEPFAELAVFAILKQPPEGAPQLKIGGKEKPSGIKLRQFEKATSPIEVSEKSLQKLNETLKKDFTDVSSKIIEESPIGETAKNLADNPKYIQESEELLNQAQQIADSLPNQISTESLRNAYVEKTIKNIEGFALNEYDKSYIKYMQEAASDILADQSTASQLVQQYRKNNGALKEYFEPGQSKALNRAKRDALLDQNRAISEVIAKEFPESNLSQVFQEGNARWSKIKDAEFIDEFINDIFKEGVDFKKMKDIFRKQGYDKKFTRALGERGYKDFQQLIEDMLTSQKPYTMLKVAKDKGFNDLFATGLGYILHPKIGMGKAALDTVKYGYRGFINAMIDKPQLGITFKKGVNNLKKGNFEGAEAAFKTLDAEIDGFSQTKRKEKATEIIEVKDGIISTKKPKSNDTLPQRLTHSPKPSESKPISTLKAKPESPSKPKKELNPTKVTKEETPFKLSKEDFEDINELDNYIKRKEFEKSVREKKGKPTEGQQAEIDELKELRKEFEKPPEKKKAEPKPKKKTHLEELQDRLKIEEERYRKNKADYLAAEGTKFEKLRGKILDETEKRLTNLDAAIEDELKSIEFKKDLEYQKRNAKRTKSDVLSDQLGKWHDKLLALDEKLVLEARSGKKIDVKKRAKDIKTHQKIQEKIDNLRDALDIEFRKNKK